MNKTISINLGGRNFIIEEEAQIKLQNYLISIKNHCGIEADTEEVMADIEIGMAEKLKANLNPYKEVITDEDVENLIKIMGTTEDFDREVGTNTSNNETKINENNNGQIARRLYRDTDNAILGGVASGLGVYFNVDPIIFRIIFIALVFAGGSGVFIYLILWLITPEAKSAHQKLEMQGQMPTIAAFERLAKNTSSAWKNKNWQARSFFDKLINLPFLAVRYLFLALKKIWNILWPIIRAAFGLGLTLFSLLALAGLGIGSLYAILQVNSAYRLSYIPISELVGSIPFIWIVASGFLTLAIPVVLLLIGGLVIFRKKTFIAFSVIAVLVGVWMAAVIACSALSLRYLPEMKEKIDVNPLLQTTNQTIDIEQIKNLRVSGNDLQVIMESGATSTVSISGRTIDLEKINITNSEGILKIEQINNDNEPLCLSCSSRNVVVKITSPIPEIITVNDRTNLSISGSATSTTLNIKDADLNLEDFSGENINLNLSGQVHFIGEIKNLTITSDADCDNSCYFESYQAKIGTLTLKTVGAPTLVLGETKSILGTISDQSNLFYKGKPQLAPELKDKQIYIYKTLNQKEYNKISQSESTEGPRLIYANGQYFSLEQNDLGEDNHYELDNEFRRAIR